MSKRNLTILSPSDDTSVSYTTSIEVVDGRDNTVDSRINPASYRQGHEPTIDAITNYLEQFLGLNRRRSRYYNNDSPKEFKYVLKIGESGFVVLFHKTDIRYYLNGMTSSKDILLRALARTIYKSCFTKEGIELDKYLYKNIMLPENVSYALENRAPFHWYIEGKKVECRFRVQMIADDECAMEISDGIWCPIKVKDLNIYMGYYWKGNKRGSWKHLSPTRLWEKLLGEYPSESQKKLMLAFLEQNRTQSIVEQRAEQLMAELVSNHPDRIKMVRKRIDDDTTKTYMVVRGKVADWVITDNQFKSDIQMVSTYVYREHTDKQRNSSSFGEGELAGAICIDNMTRHSSVGDQFCARALALLNDTFTIKMVNTIERYLNDGHKEGQTEQRIDFDKLEGYLDGFLS